MTCVRLSPPPLAPLRHACARKRTTSARADARPRPAILVQRDLILCLLFLPFRPSEAAARVQSCALVLTSPLLLDPRRTYAILEGNPRQPTSHPYSTPTTTRGTRRARAHSHKRMKWDGESRWQKKRNGLARKPSGETPRTTRRFPLSVTAAGFPLELKRGWAESDLDALSIREAESLDTQESCTRTCIRRRGRDENSGVRTSQANVDVDKKHSIFALRFVPLSLRRDECRDMARERRGA
ncbi:hypothetical protein K438DRAFT_1940499 [Mycena galopus ATCC 62051]|nr:hypothetical protein K438DRAFT_1940499 [Mycena galopus ATCC 62051]